MQSSRESGHVEILMPCQTYDPGRGSFMVHPLAVKVKDHMKHIRNPNWDPDDFDSPMHLPVFRAGNHISYDGKGQMHPEPHPEAFDFAVDYSRRARR